MRRLILLSTGQTSFYFVWFTMRFVYYSVKILSVFYSHHFPEKIKFKKEDHRLKQLFPKEVDAVPML